MHNTYRLGKFWDNIPGYEQQGICPVCETEESIEILLLEHDAPGRTQIWKLASDLWKMRSNQPLPSSYGGILRCGLTMYKKDNKWLNKLLKIIISKSAYLIWKLRYKRCIAREDNPQKYQHQEKLQSLFTLWHFS